MPSDRNTALTIGLIRMVVLELSVDKILCSIEHFITTGDARNIKKYFITAKLKSVSFLIFLACQTLCSQLILIIDDGREKLFVG
jgi:hypothetical protein